MEIKIIKGDITTLDVDAIVNAANYTLLGGGGVDGAIHRAAGIELLYECQNLNGCEVGEAKITKGYKLKAKYIIHTVGPVWNDGYFDEEDKLKSCYVNCLRLAEDNLVASIAFPSISTGAYGFPVEKACKIAYDSVKEYLEAKESVIEKVVFVCFDDETYGKYIDLVK